MHSVPQKGMICKGVGRIQAKQQRTAGCLEVRYPGLLTTFGLKGRAGSGYQLLDLEREQHGRSPPTYQAEADTVRSVLVNVSSQEFPLWLSGRKRN